MANRKLLAAMPDDLMAIVDNGYAIWASNDVEPALRARFDSRRIPVVGVRHVRVSGLQVDDERELPGLFRILSCASS